MAPNVIASEEIVVTRSEDVSKAAAKQIAEAAIAQRKLVTMQSYLQRGPQVRGSNRRRPAEQWAASVRDWSKLGMHHRPEAYDDAVSELYLRRQSFHTTWCGRRQRFYSPMRIGGSRR